MLTIELRSIGDIRPYPNNPRTNDNAVDAVAASIREYGWRQPIVVDSDGVIICGHTRYKAAQTLGIDQVPVHVATDLSPEKIRAYRIADNQSADLADWNYDLLPIELKELGEGGYDLGLLGFDADELAKLLDTGVNEGLTDPDDVPEPPDEAVTQPGDLWILGNHRCSVGTPPRRQTWIDSWPALRSTCATQILPTTSKWSRDPTTRSLRVCLRSRTMRHRAG